MKTTTYFREQVLRKRSYIRLDWIERVIVNPERRSMLVRSGGPLILKRAALMGGPLAPFSRFGWGRP